MLDDDRAEAFATEGDHPREHLEEDHAQRIDVGAVVDVGPTLALLGRHVVGRSHDGAGARLVRREVVGVRQLGQAEVQHLDEVLDAVALDEEDVLWLEIAVDDAVAVGGVEGVRDLRGDVRAPVPAEKVRPA